MALLLLKQQRRVPARGVWPARRFRGGRDDESGQVWEEIFQRKKRERGRENKRRERERGRHRNTARERERVGKTGATMRMMMRILPPDLSQYGPLERKR